MNQPIQAPKKRKIAKEAHWLKFDMHEDEAQHIGYAFYVCEDDSVLVSKCYPAHYRELNVREMMSKEAARLKYRALLDSGEYSV